MIFDLHPAVSDLVELGRKRGWLSYEELNNTLPDEMVDPERLDEFLALMDRVGIEMVDELEYKGRLYRASKNGEGAARIFSRPNQRSRGITRRSMKKYRREINRVLLDRSVCVSS